MAPGVYAYAYTMVEGKTPADMPGVLRETFTKTVEESRANPPTLVGSGYYALMELGEFAPSRIVEAVVHGFDLTDALGRETIATPDGVAFSRRGHGRTAAAPDGGRTTVGSVGRPRVGARGVGSRAARRSAPAAHRLRRLHRLTAHSPDARREPSSKRLDRLRTHTVAFVGSDLSKHA